MEKRESLYGIVNWYSYYGKTAWSVLKKKNTKKKIELPYIPAIPLLGICPMKTKTLIWKDAPHVHAAKNMHPNVRSSIIYNI